MDFSTFYLMENPQDKKAMFLTIEGEGAHLTRKETLSLFFGEWKPSSPIEFKVKNGSLATDFLWTGFPWVKCISNRVVEMLSQSKITGWGTFQVSIRDKQGTPVSGYSGLSVIPSVGPIDLTRSPIVSSQISYGKPHKVYKGLFFNENNWDATDFFRIQNALVAVTAKVKDAFQAASISNILLTPITDIELDCELFGPKEKISTHDVC